LHVYCYHRKDGKLLWHTRLFGHGTDGPVPARRHGGADARDRRQGPVLLFGTGELACLDLDGRPLWVRSLAQEYGPFRNRWVWARRPS